MKKRNLTRKSSFWLSPLALALLPLAACAQVPVDDDGNVIGSYEPVPSETYSTVPDTGNTGEEGIPLLSQTELEELVGPIALYPDDLLAVVLPAATYPLQVVQAARFLEDLETNPELEPNPEWDDSIVALINYPEVVKLLNEDLDWTWRLGDAVVAQQTDVVNAVEAFRDRAYAAGNLQSDEYQTVTRDEGIIEITPVSDEIIYVPYYEPARVVVYQPRPVYYYYPQPYPVYYYPYSSNYAFNRGYFWGVTTAFTIGWHTNNLHVFHHSYHGHPYYGRHYWDRWWYRRPTINVYNTTYVRNRVNTNRYRSGDNWQPNRSTRVRYSDRRVTRSEEYRQRRDADRDISTQRRQTTERSNSDSRQRQFAERDTNGQRQRQVDERDTRRAEQRQTRDRSSEIRRQLADRDGDSAGERRQSVARDNNQRQATERSNDRQRQREATERGNNSQRERESVNRGDQIRRQLADRDSNNAGERRQPSARNNSSQRERETVNRGDQIRRQLAARNDANDRSQARGSEQNRRRADAPRAQTQANNQRQTVQRDTSSQRQRNAGADRQRPAPSSNSSARREPAAQQRQRPAQNSANSGASRRSSEAPRQSNRDRSAGNNSQPSQNTESRQSSRSDSGNESRRESRGGERSRRR